MKQNVDLTTRREFSTPLHGMSNFNFKDMLFGEGMGKFKLALRLPNWTARSLRKPDKYLRQMGIRFFQMNLDNPDADDTLISGFECTCPRCGKAIPPWKGFCRACEHDMEKKDPIIGRDQFESWPYNRYSMQSNPRVLHL